MKNHGAWPSSKEPLGVRKLWKFPTSAASGSPFHDFQINRQRWGSFPSHREGGQGEGRFLTFFESSRILICILKVSATRSLLTRRLGYIPETWGLYHEGCKFNVGWSYYWLRLLLNWNHCFTSIDWTTARLIIDWFKLMGWFFYWPFHQALATKSFLSFRRFFGNYALDVIARCAFATRLDSHSEQTNEFVRKTKQAFSGRITPRLFVFCEYSAQFPYIFIIVRVGGDF